MIPALNPETNALKLDVAGDTDTNEIVRTCNVLSSATVKFANIVPTATS